MRIAVCGTTYSDPRSFVEGVAKFFQSPSKTTPIGPIDYMIETTINLDNRSLHFKGAVQSLFHKKNSYKIVLSDTNAVIYLLPISRESATMILDDLEVFSSLCHEIGYNHPIKYLFNDYWQGSYRGPVFDLNEIEALTGLSSLQQTSISHDPTRIDIDVIRGIVKQLGTS